MAEDLTCIKRGETPIQGRLTRSSKGLRLSIKAHPLIEQLLREWSTHEAISVGTLGREWFPSDKEPFQVWSLNQSLGPQLFGPALYYRIDQPGTPLIKIGDGMTTINISFLRLIGISEGTGKTFDIKGVYSKDYIHDLGQKLITACKSFYASYLLPVDLHIKVSTEEIKG